MKNLEQRLTQMLSQQNMTKEQYLQMTGLDEIKLQSQFSQEAKNSLEDSLIFAEIAKLEKIELTPADYDVEYEKVSKIYNQPIEQVKQTITMEQIQIPLTNDRVLDILIKYNN
jgi:trigger factor